MRYTETKERSAEILRLTLPLMAQHRAAYHPQTYTIWYEHVSGINPRLSNELEQRLARKESLSDDDVWRLHANFVIARDAEVLERMHQRLQNLLSDTATAASSAGIEATQFNQTLQIHKSQLTQPLAIDLITNIVAELITDTERMRVVTHELSEQLERSTQEARQLTEQLKQAEHQAKLDPLTGMLNRRGLEQRAESFAEDAGSLQGGVMLLADIDHFKVLNDTYGHLLGDKVIRSVAQLICDSIKGRDIAARIGGEEFAIFLPDTTLEGATVLAKRICAATASRSIRRNGTDQSVDRVTISIGVAASTATDSLETLLDRADKAMYAGKHAGRNRVTLYDPAMGASSSPAQKSLET
ncbi:GGDEF domain-containing protein [Peristeroidobacter agariperforans]|uniref:GGDEF domain-containing protein n=1 Tax=Peristeroidobacter agariperforans TaxID=268404 RepID=UPI0013005F89|nr:GGDEF domain-containing protein [Peristeroidobacter agariperforans]